MSFSPVTVGGFTITSAEFVKAAVNLKGLPKERLPQVAFLGRSNVGKSSLLNTLMGQKKLVKISATPGKTREINFFKVNPFLDSNKTTALNPAYIKT